MSLSSTIFVNESAYFFTPNILSSDVLNMTFALSRTLFWKKENNTIHWQLSLLKNVSLSWLTGRKGLMFVAGKKEDCTQWINTIHIPNTLITSSFCPQSYVHLACEQQTHFRSLPSKNSYFSLPPKIAIFRRERGDNRKCVCCSQANIRCTIIIVHVNDIIFSSSVYLFSFQF